MDNLKEKSEFLILVIFFTVSLFIYTYNLEGIPSGFHGDEAERAIEAVKMIEGRKDLLGLGWYGLPNISFLLSAVGIFIFGRGILGARIASSVVGALGVVVFYYLVKKMFSSKKSAIFSTVLLMTSHWWIAYSRLGMDYIEAAVYQMAVLLSLYLFIKKPSKLNAGVTGALLGLGWYLYFSARSVYLLAAFLVMLSLALGRLKLLSNVKYFLVMGTLFLLCSLPYIFQAVKNPNAAISRTKDVFIFSDGFGKEWRKHIYGDKNPLQVVSLQAQKSLTLSSKWSDTSGQYGYRGRVLDLLTLTFIFIGAYKLYTTRKYRLPGIFFLFWILIVVFFGVILTIEAPFSPRLLGSFPPLFAFAGIGVSQVFYTKYKNEVAETFMQSLVVVFLLIIINANLYTYFIKSEEEKFGDANKYAATEITRVIKKNKDIDNVIFLLNDRLHSGYGPFRYLMADKKMVEKNLDEITSTELPFLLVVDASRDTTDVDERYKNYKKYEIEPNYFIFRVE